MRGWRSVIANFRLGNFAFEEEEAARGRSEHLSAEEGRRALT